MNTENKEAIKNLHVSEQVRLAIRCILATKYGDISYRNWCVLYLTDKDRSVEAAREAEESARRDWDSKSFFSKEKKLAYLAASIADTAAILAESGTEGSKAGLIGKARMLAEYAAIEAGEQVSDELLTKLIDGVV